ncbi:hypothetical protein H9P43_008660 [Blastocladiella emersonii ATCC 22665]|nr:hypothetical protein H9P43_008660 [Blastocladiella emersonii ATCC 22665]
MSFIDVDGSYISVNTSDPEHSVRLTVELHYFLQRDLETKAKRKINKSTADLKDRQINPQSGTQDGVPPGEALPRYYMTYNIGTMYEGKSEILHPSNSFWSNTHEIDVSLDFLAELYEGPIEFKIWQVKKVWGEDPLAAKGGSLGAAPSQQTLLFRRASINAIAKRLVTLSRTEQLSPKTRRKIEHFRSYVLHNYKQMPLTVKVVAPTVPPQRPLVDYVKIPAAPHIAGSTNARAAILRSSQNSSRASSASTQRSVGGTATPTSAATTNAAAASPPPPPQQAKPAAPQHQWPGIKGGKEDLSAICTFSRPKTPPHPHHFDEPDRTLHLVPDLPRRNRTLVDQHTHVGSIFVDLSFFFLGEIHAKGALERRIEGMQDAEVGVSLSGPLLTPRQEESLNPMVITVQGVENLPDRPLAYDQLRRICHPVYTRFAFLDHPAARHRSRASAAHQRAVRLDSRHVILTGLHDEDALRDYFLHSKLTVELHDRDKKSSSGAAANNPEQDKLAPIQSYGVARFSLAELVAGATSLSMKASVVPAESGAVLGSKHAVAPGFYLECDTMIKVKVESKFAVFGLGESSNNITRAVFVCPASAATFLERVLQFVESHNLMALRLASLDELHELCLSKEQRRNTQLDMITGFLVTDGGMSILFLEGCIRTGMQKLHELIETLDTTAIVAYFNLTLTFSSRAWAQLHPNVAWLHLGRPLAELMLDPKLFIRSHYPRTAYQALRNCNDIAGRVYSTVFELSAHGLLPTLEQFLDLAGVKGVASVMDRVPLDRLFAAMGVVPRASSPAAAGLASSQPDAAASDSPSCRAARVKSYHSPTSSPAKWLRSHDLRSISPVRDAVAAYTDSFYLNSSPSPPRARVPAGTADVFPYSIQTSNARVADQVERIAIAAAKSPRNVLVFPHEPARAVALDGVRRPPWDEATDAYAWDRVQGPGWDPRPATPVSECEAVSVRRESPFRAPNALDVIQAPLPELRGEGGAPGFHVVPVKKPLVPGTDCRVVFVSNDMRAELPSRERRFKVQQRIMWDERCGAAGSKV